MLTRQTGEKWGKRKEREGKIRTRIKDRNREDCKDAVNDAPLRQHWQLGDDLEVHNEQRSRYVSSREKKKEVSQE